MSFVNPPYSPDFFIVGAAKAGTTAVWTMLRHHPQVFLPATKEPGYFACVNGIARPKSGPYDPDYISRMTTDPAAYGDLYRNADGRLCGDVSPVYLTHDAVPGRIAAARPDARIVILLRDPVERAFSQYLHHLRDGLEPCASFEAALTAEPDRTRQGWSWGHRYAGNGHYAAMIRRYHKAFPRRQILVLDYQTLQNDPQLFWQRVCAHLAIKALPLPEIGWVNATTGLATVSAWPGVTRRIHHPGPAQSLLKKAIPRTLRSLIRQQLDRAGRPVPVLSEDTRRKLARRYLPERPLVEALTGLHLSHWSME